MLEIKLAAYFVRRFLRYWCPARCLAIIAGWVMTGCAHIEPLDYYLQSAQGHVSVLRAARPIDEWLADSSTSSDLKVRLSRVREIREFASTELGLPDNDSYRHYAHLERAFVVWNVFAAPPTSLRLREWCFPIAGCVAYRGYYDHAMAETIASRLRAGGWDTYVAGIPAYSTLGWTPDPVLSTFIQHPEAEVARLIFHELAHQWLYVQDDTAFNESFATAVEREGVRRWLERRSEPGLTRAWEISRARRAAFLGLIAQARADLIQAYAKATTKDEAIAAKKLRIAALRVAYTQSQEDPANPLYGFRGYDRYFSQDLNNAHLAAFALYTQWVPAFDKLLLERGRDMRAFVAEARRVATLPIAERHRRLRGLMGHVEK